MPVHCSDGTEELCWKLYAEKNLKLGLLLTPELFSTMFSNFINVNLYLKF